MSCGGDILANFAWGTDTRWKPYWDATRWPVADWGEGWTDEFHIWEWEWDEEHMVIRLDGQVLNEASLDATINGAACAGQNPFQQPHRLLQFGPWRRSRRQYREPGVSNPLPGRLCSNLSIAGPGASRA